MWVFGYGSLLWYQDFPFDKCISGKVSGYCRKFWQHSPDHRGTPEKPGRTVTLVKEEGGTCWGKAFRVPTEHVESTRAYLDFREKAGYSTVKIRFYPDDPSIEPFDVETYMNIADNEHHAGPSENEEIAQTIVTSHGPSGPNLEYLLRLAKILHKESPIRDDHVYELEQRTLELCKEKQIGTEILHKLGYQVVAA